MASVMVIMIRIIFLLFVIVLISSCEKYEGKQIGTKLPVPTKEDLKSSAQFFTRIKSYKEAEKTYWKIISKYPAEKDVYYNLADVFKVQRKYDELIDLYNRIIAKFPEISDEIIRKKETLFSQLWRWKELLFLVDEMIDSKKFSGEEIDNLKKKKDSLEHLVNLELLFEEGFDNSKSSGYWGLHNTYNGKIFEETLNLSADKERGFLAGVNFIYKTGALKICVDFKIDLIPYASSVSIKLLVNEKSDVKECVRLSFGSWGAVGSQGGEIINYSFSADSQYESSNTLLKDISQGFDLSTWYTAQFEYIPHLSILTVNCFQREAGNKILCRVAYKINFSSEQSLIFGFFKESDEQNEVRQVEFSIDNVKIFADKNSVELVEEKDANKMLSMLKGDVQFVYILSALCEKQKDWSSLFDYSDYILSRSRENKNAQKWFEIAVYEMKKELDSEKVSKLEEGEFVRRGNLYKKIGMYEEARKEFEAAISLEPELLDAKLELVDVLFQLGKKDDSMKMINELLQVHPNSTKVLYKAGWFLFITERFKESAEFLEKSAQQVDADENVLSLLGIVYYNLKDYQKSIECFEKLLAKFPDNVDGDIWKNSIEILKNLKK